MTPEERYTRLENLVQSTIEMQANLSEAQAKLAERQEKQQLLIDQDRAAIRDLIGISRSLIESQKQTDMKLKALSEEVRLLTETVRSHEGKIEALIDTVDRIIRRDQHPS